MEHRDADWTGAATAGSTSRADDADAPETEPDGEDIAAEDLTGEDVAGEDVAGEDMSGEDVSAGDTAGAHPGTGEPRVDAALRLLDELATNPVSEHPGLYERVHAQLSDVLGELDTGPGS